MNRDDDVIRASEMGEYAYCARAWWLKRVRGYHTTNVGAMQQGVARHRRHGRAVAGYQFVRRLAVGLLLLAAAVLIAWLLLSLGS